MPVDVDGASATASAFRRYAGDAPKLVTDAGAEWAASTAPVAAGAGRSSDRQSARVAATVRAVRGREPAITVGGSGRIGGMVFGSEFGGGARKTTRQFRTFAGHRGYWLYPTFRQREAERVRTTDRALVTAATRWGRGG